MDVSSYMDLHHACQIVFNALPQRREQTRFMMPTSEGGWRPVTWGAFAQEIECAGLALHTLGLSSGDRLALLGHNSLPWFITALAAQGIGGVMVPIYPSSTTEQIGYVLSHSEAKAVVVGSKTMLERVVANWPQLSGHVSILLGLKDDLAIDHVLEASGLTLEQQDQVRGSFHTWSGLLQMGGAVQTESPEKFQALMADVSLDQPGMMLYTSGTTGPPKGVPLTHRNVASNGRDWMVCNAPLLDEGAVDLLWLPLSHIFGFGEACLGNTLGFVTYWTDPSQALTLLPEVQPHVFMSVPRLFEKIAMGAMELEDEEAQKAHLRQVTGGRFKFCLSGGAGLKQEVKEFLYRHGILIIEGYGLTETSPTLTLNRPDDFRFDSVGKPLPSVSLKLAEDGEILAKGPNVFSGYFRDEASTKDAFDEEGWLKTGDVGRWTEDGFLQIIDRKKEILVTAGGKNVPPANIEVRFRDEPLIAHVVVYGDGKPFLSAGVWLQQDHPDISKSDESLHAVVSSCVARANQGLAKHETIKKFVIMQEPLGIENGMLTPTLKVKRKKVYEHFVQDFEEMYSS